MNMLKFAVFCALFTAATATSQCYNGGAKMTAFSQGTGDKKVDLLSIVPAAEKEYQKSSVKTCAAKEACFEYTVTATATVVVTDDKGVPVKTDGKTTTTNGDMAWITQNCLEEATAESAVVEASICTAWQKGIEDGFKADATMKDIVSNIKATCGKPKKCDGDKCVAEAHRSNAATFGFSALLLTLVYLF